VRREINEGGRREMKSVRDLLKKYFVGVKIDIEYFEMLCKIH